MRVSDDERRAWIDALYSHHSLLTDHAAEAEDDSAALAAKIRVIARQLGQAAMALEAFDGPVTITITGSK